MSSASSSRLQNVLFALLSFVIATGLWYFVVGRDHVETQMTVRVDYRGLPDGLVIREGIVNQLTVHLRGSAELLRNLHSRDIVYTVNLSEVKRGANSLALHLSGIPEFKAFEILEVSPRRLVLEVDAITERVIPLEQHLLPLPASSPYFIANVVLEPSVVTVRGPESQIHPLKLLAVVYDPTKNASEGLHEANVAIMAPAQVEVTPPVTTLSYTMEAKTADIELEHRVELDDSLRAVEVSPETVELSLSVPEAMAEDKEYLNAIHVTARPAHTLEPGVPAEVPLMVLLPSGAKLNSVTPSSVSLTLKLEDAVPWKAAETPYVLHVPSPALQLTEPPLPLEFSFDGFSLPQTDASQTDEFKIQPVPPVNPTSLPSGLTPHSLPAGENTVSAPVSSPLSPSAPSAQETEASSPTNPLSDEKE